MNLEDKLYVITDRVSPNTNSIIEYFASKDKRIIVIKSLEPGIVSALNLGIESSQSEFIARMDSDDVVINGRFGAQKKFLISHPEYVLVGSNIKIIDKYGNFLGIRYFPNKNSSIKEMLYYYNPIAHPAVMYRRTSIIKVGSYRAGTDGFEDYDLWLKLIEVGKFKNLMRVYLSYRVHSNQFSFVQKGSLLRENTIKNLNSKKSAIRIRKLFNSIKDSPLIIFKYKNIYSYILCLTISPRVILKLTFFYIINSNRIIRNK
jgi:glycosyltransferase involved in cell wall biosynthesis